MNCINVLLAKLTILVEKWLIQTIQIFVRFTIQTIRALNFIFVKKHKAHHVISKVLRRLAYYTSVTITICYY